MGSLSFLMPSSQLWLIWTNLDFSGKMPRLVCLGKHPVCWAVMGTMTMGQVPAPAGGVQAPLWEASQKNIRWKTSGAPIRGEFSNFLEEDYPPEELQRSASTVCPNSNDDGIPAGIS